MEVGKIRVYLEPMCPLENCQWCGEPCFAGVAILMDGFSHNFPDGTDISHCMLNESFGFVYS
jgi:hypothetical protein